MISEDEEKYRREMKRLVEKLRPRKGSGIDSFSISYKGTTVTLHQDGRNELTEEEK